MLTIDERFNILRKEKIDIRVYHYLKKTFEPLNIEILGECTGNLFDLMKKGKLEGYCWETTESAALFMQDDAIIYRGDLYFDEHKTYYHSFIEFDYEGQKYIFDPCLQMINTSSLYFKTFEIDIKGQVTAKEVKDYFINYINNPPKRENTSSADATAAFDRFMKEFFSDDYYETKDEIVIYDKEDPSAPMYRNGCGYKRIDVEKNKIKSLTVHYYING